MKVIAVEVTRDDVSQVIHVKQKVFYSHNRSTHYYSVMFDPASALSTAIKLIAQVKKMTKEPTP